MAERLLHHHPGVAPVPAAAAQPGLADPADGVGEQLGDQRQVEQPVAVGAELAVEAVQQVADAAVGVGVGRGAGDVVQPAGERLPHLVLDGLGAGELLDRLAHVGPVLLVGVLAAAGPDEGEVLRQQPVQLQVVEGGDDLAVGQVAGAAEHHHGRRRRDRPDPLPRRQGVVRHRPAQLLRLGLDGLDGAVVAVGELLDPLALQPVADVVLVDAEGGQVGSRAGAPGPGPRWPSGRGPRRGRRRPRSSPGAWC